MPADGATLAANADDLTRLYDEYGAKIYRYCLGRLRSKEDAEDAQQNTFLRVYTALRQGTVPAYEAAWLYKIAHNVCLSRVESATARSRVETPRDLAALEAELAAPSGRRDELIGLEDALAELPANLRQAILLREWQGLSYAEIAEALGVSVSAVEALIFRARRRLAHSLEQGVARPARRVSAALNLSWLFRQLHNHLSSAARSLLSGGRVSLAAAGPAKIVAAVALVAAGGGGVGAGLALGTSPSTDRSGPQATVRAVTGAVRRADLVTGHREPTAEPARAAGRTSLATAAGSGPSLAPGVPSAVLPGTNPAAMPAPSAAPPGGPPESLPSPADGTSVPGATPAASPATTPVSTTIASTTGAVATAAVPTIAAPAAPPAPTVSAPAIPATGSSAPDLPGVVDPVPVVTTQAPVVPPVAALPVVVVTEPPPVTTTGSLLRP